MQWKVRVMEIWYSIETCVTYMDYDDKVRSRIKRTVTLHWKVVSCAYTIEDHCLFKMNR